MDLATRVRIARSRPKEANPFRDRLEAQLERLNKTGQTEVEGRKFSIDDVSPLNQMLLVEGFKEGVSASIEPRGDGSIKYTIGDMLGAFAVNDTAVTVAINSKTTDDNIPPCTMLLGSSSSGNLHPMSMTAYVEGMEGQLEHPSNPLTSLLINQIGMENAFN